MLRFSKGHVRLLLFGGILSLIAPSCRYLRRHPVTPDATRDSASPTPARPDPALAERYFEKGQRLESSGDYDQAAEAYTHAIAAVNDYYPAWLHRGRVDLLRNQPSAALMYLEAAVSLRSDDPQALHWRGDARLRLGEPGGAIADYERALAGEKDMLERAAIYAARGEAYTFFSEDAKALDDYSNAIRWRPGAADPYFKRGILLRKLGRLAEAVRDFNMAVALQASHEAARAALRETNEFLAQAAPKPAPQPVVTVVTPPVPAPTPVAQAEPPPRQIEPELKPLRPEPPTQPQTVATPAARSAEAHWRTARDLIYARREAEAIKELDVALRLRPDYAEAFNARGFAWLLQRQYDRAIADFDAALRIAPQYPNAIHNRSVAVQAAARATRAKPPAPAPAATSSNASPTPAESRWRAARDMIQAGRYQDAVHQLNGAIDMKPTYAQAFNARGFAWLLLRQYQRAIADFDQALLLLPNYPNAVHNRSVALKAAGAAGISVASRN